MSSDHKFQVNLRGIIDLLSEHLYSGPDVYLRELLQNAADAIAARQHHAPEHAGEVVLEVIQPRGASRPPTLLVQDNGVGLTEDEIHEFLATIGQSSKRDTNHDESYIGQFGIGLLSGFVVSNEIVVITRSVQAGSPTIEWRGRSDGTYDVRKLEGEHEAGTQVYLRAKPDCAEYFTPDFVERTARHFGGLLPYPVRLKSGRGQIDLNETPPWQMEFSSANEQCESHLAYGRRVFETDFLDAIPLRSQAGGVEGIAFVLASPIAHAARRTHRVYLKNMLISEKADNLLPDWAFFVKCVLNARRLRPTASRESFYEDDALREARETLGNALRDYLVRMARNDQDRLHRLIGIHYQAMKALAVDDDEFYALFIDLLPFETTLGDMTLGDYVRRHKRIHYVATRDEFRQIAAVAAAQSMCVINAGYAYDRDLLEKLPTVFPERSAQRVSSDTLTDNFADLDLDEREQTHDFWRLAEAVLQPFRCRVDLRKFEPRGLPALFTVGENGTFHRSIEQSREVADELWSGVLDGLEPETGSTSETRLTLNLHNPLIQRLAGVRQRELARRAVEMLYTQSLLLGHFPLHAREMKLLNEGLLGLIELAIEKPRKEDST